MSLPSPGPNGPLLLDGFCGAGGAGRGYSDAGFRVVGVDIDPQPNYPFEFHQADFLEVMGALLAGETWQGYVLADFATFHASCPCQAWTKAQRIQHNVHPEFIAAVREMFERTGKPWVLENVPGAPLRDPVVLCGAMFPPLRVYRHRLFETNFPLPQPPEPPHIARQAKMGRQPGAGEWIQCVGNFTDPEFGRVAMGTPWMARNDMSEAIPPAYAEWVGRYLLAAVRESA